MHRIVIVGGGISGLATAHRLDELSRAQRLPLAITLLEASERFGGAIHTETRDGFLLEGGPDAFMVERPWALELCRRLGIADELIETQPGCRRSFIVRRGRLVPVPEGWYLIAPSNLWALVQTPLLSWPGKLRMACEPLVPARRDSHDESVGGFIRRRFGQEVLERIGQPMLAGIYTADPDRLSLQATMPRFQEMEQRNGSILKALWATARRAPQGAVRAASGPRYSLFATFRHGMRTLVDRLIQQMLQMPEVSLRRSAPVARIAHDGSWTVTLQGGSSLQAEHLCLALPAHQAAILLRSCATDLSQALGSIPYESVATVNLGFRTTDIPRTLQGFGMVVPALERRRIVGCTFSSVKFAGRAPDTCALLRAFVGGAGHRQLVERDDDALGAAVREELRDLLGIMAVPLFTSIQRHPQAMPQYEVGHLDRITAIDATLARYPGLWLAGNGYRGMGLPECIHQAEATAERIIATPTRDVAAQHCSSGR